MLFGEWECLEVNECVSVQPINKPRITIEIVDIFNIGGRSNCDSVSGINHIMIAPMITDVIDIKIIGLEIVILSVKFEIGL
jgi:hypothetical protein